MDDSQSARRKPKRFFSDKFERDAVRLIVEEKYTFRAAAVANSTNSRCPSMLSNPGDRGERRQIVRAAQPHAAALAQRQNPRRTKTFARDRYCCRVSTRSDRVGPTMPARACSIASSQGVHYRHSSTDLTGSERRRQWRAKPTQDLC